MKQITENPKVISRSIDLFLKKDPSFREEDSVKLIEGISEKPIHKLDGKIVDPKKISFSTLMQTEVSGASGWHRFEDAFDQQFTSTKFSGDGHVDKALNEAFEGGQNDFGNVFGDKIRSVSVGDVFSVQEWGEDGHGLGLRFFLVANVGFDEFKRATGVFL